MIRVGVAASLTILVAAAILPAGLADAQAAPSRFAAPPLVTSPTASGATVHVACTSDPGELHLDVTPAAGKPLWRDVGAGAASGAADDEESARSWRITGLEAATRYRYRVRSGEVVVGAGSFITARPPGAAFTFALLTDAHILVRDFSDEELQALPLTEAVVKRYGSEANARWTLRMYRAYGHAVLPRVARLVLEDRPDFVINLGDVIDLHGFGFNVPVPEPRWARKGFLDYRRLLGPLGARAAHFMVMGNWDGEKGHFTAAEQQRSRAARLSYLPNPGPDTYPQGGGPRHDYFAFTWGDALFVVLNVISYTPTGHMLDRTADPGRPDDYTLGAAQLAWLERTLAAARTRWKFICIHHPVGGCGGDARNSAYARGGGRAARVGEQARVHELMRRHGVNAFFYGHDHVFTDMVVDGIHYTLPGSAGAPWKFGVRETGYARYWTDSGYARVRVSAERVEVVFVNADGHILYRYALPD